MTTPADPRPNVPADDLEALATLYAAGALPPEEAAAVEARIAAGDRDLAAAVAAYEGTVEALVESLPPVTPPPSVKAALLARIAEEPAPSPSSSPMPEGVAAPFVSRAADAEWLPREVDGAVVEGVALRVLWLDEAAMRVAVLLRMDAGATYPAHVHAQPEDFFVLEGDLSFGDGPAYGAGDFVRFPPGSLHESHHTEGGCLCLVVTALQNDYV